jgi:hypothetical protein
MWRTMFFGAIQQTYMGDRAQVSAKLQHGRECLPYPGEHATEFISLRPSGGEDEMFYGPKRLEQVAWYEICGVVRLR